METGITRAASGMAALRAIAYGCRFCDGHVSVKERVCNKCKTTFSKSVQLTPIYEEANEPAMAMA
jgi:hypothetical protein